MSENINEECSPPEKDDVLFTGDMSDWHNNAMLNYTHDGNAVAYTEGYRRAAVLLVEHVVTTHRSQDVLIYPIVFLYRHYLELVLKAIIGRAPYLLGKELSPSEKRHLTASHNLQELWDDLKPFWREICKKAGWKPCEENLDGVDSYIRQLCAVDEGSFAFRYSTTKSGALALPSDLKHINIRHFSELMERLGDYLEGLDTATSQLEEAKIEMEMEYRSEMRDGW